MNKRVLIVAAHADDEVIGYGGTIARHVAEGDDVYVIFMADGVGSRVAASKADMSQRERAAEAAGSFIVVRILR
jgi:N-acetylglucosamine malate deacetylase 1